MEIVLKQNTSQKNLVWFYIINNRSKLRYSCNTLWWHKGIVLPKNIFIIYLFVPNPNAFLSSAEHKRIDFAEHWRPNNLNPNVIHKE